LGRRSRYLTTFLDNTDLRQQSEVVEDLAIVDSPATALAMLDPARAEILATLDSPGSATTVAKHLGLSRQKVSYHLKTLEVHQLVHLVEERPRRGLTERIMLASARSYVISPSALGPNASEPVHTDKMSSNYLVALAARIVREIAELTVRSKKAEKCLTVLALDTEIRFASASDRADFAADLSNAVTALASRYHDENATRGSWYRVMVAAHPRPTISTSSKES